MNFDFYLFGTPDGYDQYPLVEKGQLFQSFFDKSCPIQLILYRNAELVYFTYIRNINANQDSYFGMSLVFNGAYPSNLAEVIAVFESLFVNVINKGRFLRKDKFDHVVFTGIRLADAQEEIEELTRNCRTLVENRLSLSETRLPDEYVVQEREASFAFDSNYLPTPLDDLLKHYKKISLTKGKDGNAQKDLTSQKKERKWIPIAITILVFGLLVGIYLLIDSIGGNNAQHNTQPSEPESEYSVNNQPNNNESHTIEGMTINDKPESSETNNTTSRLENVDDSSKQTESSVELTNNQISAQNATDLFPYETYFLGSIGSNGVLAIDKNGGGYCTYNRNGTDLTRNIKVVNYDRSTGKLTIKAYDKQGHYVGKFDGYTKNNNSYNGTFTLDSDGSSMTFNLQVKSQSNKNDKSNGLWVVIDGKDLRLRYGPTLSSDTYKWPDGHNRHPNVGEKFRYLGESGDFYKIDFNSTKLWVSKQHTHRE